MAVRVKLLKQVLSLQKQGCSDQVCIQAIMESCKTCDMADTITAFFNQNRVQMGHKYFMLQAEYQKHLETCGKYNKKADQTISKEEILQEINTLRQELYISRDLIITGIDEKHFDSLAHVIYNKIKGDQE